MRTSRQAGFSLIEQLAAVFILAVIATIGFAAFKGPKDKVQVGELQTKLSTAANSIMQWGTQAGMPTTPGATNFDGLYPCGKGATPPANKTCVGEVVPDAKWVGSSWADGADNQMLFIAAAASLDATASEGSWSYVRSCRAGYFNNGDALCLQIELDPLAAGGGDMRHRYYRAPDATKHTSSTWSTVGTVKSGSWPPTPKS